MFSAPQVGVDRHLELVGTAARLAGGALHLDDLDLDAEVLEVLGDHLAERGVVHERDIGHELDREPLAAPGQSR